MAQRARRSHEPGAGSPHADPPARRRRGGVLGVQLPRRASGPGRQAGPHVARHLLRLLRRQGRPAARHAGGHRRRDGRPARPDSGFRGGPRRLRHAARLAVGGVRPLPGALGDPRRAARRHRRGRRPPHHHAGPAGAATLDDGARGSHPGRWRHRHRSLPGGRVHLQRDRPRHAIEASGAARHHVRRAGRRLDRARPSVGLRVGRAQDGSAARPDRCGPAAGDSCLRRAAGGWRGAVHRLRGRSVAPSVRAWAPACRGRCATSATSRPSTRPR